ncbi:hypothetical protein CYJ76_00420 [Kytococcus schroeteri]|uniref:DinB-like domain-containing protein n=2 Tax=Kytococcus schroeteri TaxID=138300 RepID=A0A2I1PDU0_9MICO|nr:MULTISPECIES: DinB family protein [Kytococcus]OFS06920.1 hypothetical protein HMPREF3099_10760 [Kytococcus sp. HMSC28H12]PKZ42760.1 hypothetical protein CYJ76_00420 [Kytococcus schroeteri]
MDEHVDGVDLSGATLQHVRVAGASMTKVDASGADIRGLLMEGARIRGGAIVHTRIDCDVFDLVINGVDVAPLIDAELNRRDPDRALLFATDPDGIRAAWARLEELWEGTIERARTLPGDQLHASVDGEWSFVQTLRHLNFKNAAWAQRVLRGEPDPYAPLDLPWDEAPAIEGFTPVRDARPGLGEVLAERSQRCEQVRAALRPLDDAALAGTVTRAEPGWPQVEDLPVAEAVHVLLMEEYEHRLFAERDLDALTGVSTSADPTTPPTSQEP